MTSGERPSAKLVARRATEAAMLAAAMRMLLDSPTVDILSALKPVEIARRAEPSKTTGAFYNIWPTHAGFRRALLEHVLSMDRFRGDRETEELLRQFIASPGVSINDVIRVAANKNFTELVTEPWFRLQVALWTQHATDADVHDRLRSFYRALSESLVPLYSQLLEMSGRRLRPPYDATMFAVTLTALVEGLAMRAMVDPDAVATALPAPPGLRQGLPGEADENEPWTLFASVTYLIFDGMTEPLPPT